MANKKTRKLKLLKVERLLYAIVVLLLLISPVAILFSKATLSKLNVDVEQLKIEVKNQTKKNQSLTMKVNEMVSLDNIKLVAQDMGLKYNNDNIKVIAD
jgi:cell division protein FtsL